MKRFQKIDTISEPVAAYPALDKFKTQASPRLLEEALERELALVRDYHRENRTTELEFLESVAVKHVHKIASGFIARVENEPRLRRLLYRSKQDIFPTAWMERKVKATMDRHPALTPLLNYVYNLNRRSSNRQELFGEKLGTLAQIREFNQGLGIITEEPGKSAKARGRTWPLAVFDVHRNFYRDAGEVCGCSEALVKKMVHALVRGGIYRVAHDNFDHSGRWRWLSDGYFTATHEDALPTKHTFVTNTEEVIRALRELKV